MKNTNIEDKIIRLSNEQITTLQDKAFLDDRIIEQAKYIANQGICIWCDRIVTNKNLLITDGVSIHSGKCYDEYDKRRKEIKLKGEIGFGKTLADLMH